GAPHLELQPRSDLALEPRHRGLELIRLRDDAPKREISRLGRHSRELLVGRRARQHYLGPGQDCAARVVYRTDHRYLVPLRHGANCKPSHCGYHQNRTLCFHLTPWISGRDRSRKRVESLAFLKKLVARDNARTITRSPAMSSNSDRDLDGG